MKCTTGIYISLFLVQQVALAGDYDKYIRRQEIRKGKDGKKIKKNSRAEFFVCYR